MERIEASDYRDIVQVSDPELSPDGERVAFVRKVPDDEESYEATIYVVPVGGEEPREFTIAEGVDSEPRFSPSGDRLAFVSTRGADDDRPQLWVMPTDGGEARRVTNVAGGVSSIVWSPDGTRIAFAQESTPEEREEGYDRDVEEALGEDEEEYEREEPDPRVIDRLVYRSAERYFDGARSHVYLADLGSDGVERLTDGDYDFLAPEWGDASTLYYAVKRTGDPDDNTIHDIVAHDLDAEETETVVQTPTWMPLLAATEDGRIAYPYRPEERGTLRQSDIHVHDRGTDETHAPTEGLDRTLGVDVEWGPNGEDVFFGTPDEGTMAIRRVAWDGGEVETVVRDGHVDGFSVGENAIAFTQSEWDHRGDVFAATLGGAEGNRLTRVNADYLDGRAVPQPEEIRFESEGAEIQGWVLTPPDFDPGAEYPLAVEVHGGPHAMWSTSGTMWHEFQTLAARGYVVFWCNPRGSTGYGEEFMAAIERDWGETTMTDVMAGVEEVREREYVDGEDVFLTGGSFGGYMTGWMVGHTDRFSAAVAQRGVYHLHGFYGGTDQAFKLVEWDYGATPWEEPEFLWEHSPIAYADQVETPTLIVHAENDFRVPVSDGEAFFRYLRKGDVDTRFVRYPREGHELSRSGEPGHVVDRLERIVRWFDGYSDHHDVPRALERGEEGLSTGDEADEGG